MFVRHENGRFDPRLLDESDAHGIWHVCRIVHLRHRAVRQMYAIDDRGCSRDQIEIELALKPLADDLEMKQAQKAAAKAEPERGRTLGFIGEACIVEMELAQRVAQIFEQRGVDGKQAAEHDLLRRLESG